MSHRAEYKTQAISSIVTLRQLTNLAESLFKNDVYHADMQYPLEPLEHIHDAITSLSLLIKDNYDEGMVRYRPTAFTRLTKTIYHLMDKWASRGGKSISVTMIDTMTNFMETKLPHNSQFYSRWRSWVSRIKPALTEQGATE